MKTLVLKRNMPLNIYQSDTDGAYPPPDAYGESSNNFSMVQNIYRFDVPPGYYLSSVRAMNIPPMAPNKYRAALAISTDLETWVPVEFMVGQRLDGGAIFVNELYFDIMRYQTNAFTDYDLDSGSSITWADIDKDWEIWLTPQLVAAPNPVRYDLSLWFEGNDAMQSSNGTEHYLLSLPFFTHLSYEIFLRVQNPSVLTNYEAWLVRLPIGDDYDNYQYPNHLEQITDDSHGSILGTTDFWNFSGGAVLHIKATDNDGSAPQELISAHINATPAVDVPFLSDSKAISAP